MPLIQDLQQICNNLAPKGWRDLLLQHGIDITATDLAAELAKDLPSIRRDLPGFEDFAMEGRRGIEPGKPARSLLFHALASPNVVNGVTAFPTLKQLDTVENYVYGVRPPSVTELSARAQNSQLAIVVFATEYRPSSQTVHQKHADVCFARTGIARVGTADALFTGNIRGFLPFKEGDAFAFRVLPARYAAYVATLQMGDRATFIPMRFIVADAQQQQMSDAGRQFWIPLHKLFSGSECLSDVPDLHVTFSANHVNQKLRRVHISLKGNATWHEPDIGNPPFIFTKGIAEFATDGDLPPGTLVPAVHPTLVEPATYKNKPLTFHVPPNYPDWLSSSMSIPAEQQRWRHGPEYVHARRKVLPDGTETDMNQDPDVEAAVMRGGYDARHFVDFTGDGWIDVTCPELATELPRTVPAYSLVTAPDFFPSCDQRELTEWTARRLPPALRNAVWVIPPDTLCDQRFPANLELPGAGFQADDDTVTAIVSLPVDPRTQPARGMGTEAIRHSHLPDDAAGVFAPGWDISLDGHPDTGIQHLAAYGLGSPFPEDAKLCAALSTFWAAVAPDATRTFVPTRSGGTLQWPTVSPLTDEEIGQTGNRPWDGIAGPKITRLQGKDYADYLAFANADYVNSALTHKFSLAATARIDDTEYKSRVLSMVHVYEALGVNLTVASQAVRRSKARWSVFSFTSVSAGDSDLTAAQTQTKVKLQGRIYKFKMFLHGEPARHPTDPQREISEIKEMVTLLADPKRVLIQRGGPAWKIGHGPGNVPI